MLRLLQVILPVPQPRNEDVFDAIVIGGGVVGLAVAREIAVHGDKVLLLEKTASFASAASSGNSGLGCTGYDAPPGSLERKLLRRSIQRHPALYRSFGLSYDHVNKCGSLVVAWSQEELDKLPAILKENHDVGDTEAQLLTREELLEMEPSLSRNALGAVLTPREMIAEPWLIPMGYLESARVHGADLRLSAHVVGGERNSAGWSIFVEGKDTVCGRVVINCAGLYGDTVEHIRCKEAQDFTIQPRKGQFVVFDTGTLDHIIEPVPTQRTKGVIVWTTLYGNTVVGPTAEDQDSREDRSNDAHVVAKLRTFGESVVPALKHANVIGTYSGIRPATEHRDYQIEAHPKDQWITVGGIRSTGLTGSSGIAEYVAALYFNITEKKCTPPTWEAVAPPYHPAPLEPRPSKHNARVPSLQRLAENFRSRGDGCVEIYPGRVERVTHPISFMGMHTFKGY